MARKKGAPVDLEADEEVPQKLWRANPPGPEQKELVRLFERGLIGGTDTPGKVRSRNQMFMAYPAKTFALHFRTTKAKLGLNAVVKATPGIPELDGIVEEANRSEKSPIIVMESQIEAKNFPYITWTYTDHNEQKEIICVLVPIVTGSRDIKFVVSDDGMQVFVQYVWPFEILEPIEVFNEVSNDDDDGAISMNHPMVYSYRNRLDQLDLSDKSRPSASLVITLPMRVQRELGTYRKQALKCGETRLVLLRFTAYQKQRVLYEADNSIKF